jgi:pyrophosphatase PpaX
MLKAVLWDLDGTLIDTKPLIVGSFEHTSKAHGLPVITREMIHALGGASLRGTYHHYCPDVDIEALVLTHCEFQNRHMHLVSPFPDTVSTLVEVGQLGLQNGIITSRLKNALMLMDHCGVTEFIDALVTADDVENAKPHPEGMLKVLNMLELTADEVCFVGDTESDIQLGRNTGVRTIGVACGFSSAEELQRFQANHVVATVADVLPIVRSLI